MLPLLGPSKLYIYKKIVSMKTDALAPYLYNFLQNFYPNVITNDSYDYILAEGDIPIALVAHMDTVFKNPPTNIYYDQMQEVVWSLQGGIGDDRAGIFMVLSILFETKKYRPTIIFTNDEEFGGLGAEQLVTDYPLPPWDINFLVELDRHGVKDAVFYDCVNEEFINYITGFGFDFSPGIFTDICKICPIWGIAGVNLSIGYINEHSIIETWHVTVAKDTYDKVLKILEDNNTIKYIYIEDDKKYMCSKCKTYQKESDMFSCILEDGTAGYICLDCTINTDIDWCNRCGKLFIGSGNLCWRCKINDRDDYDFSWNEI